jgi:hypothetical protein
MKYADVPPSPSDFSSGRDGVFSLLPKSQCNGCNLGRIGANSTIFIVIAELQLRSLPISIPNSWSPFLKYNSIPSVAAARKKSVCTGKGATLPDYVDLNCHLPAADFNVSFHR